MSVELVALSAVMTLLYLIIILVYLLISIEYFLFVIDSKYTAVFNWNGFSMFIAAVLVGFIPIVNIVVGAYMYIKVRKEYVRRGIT